MASSTGELTAAADGRIVRMEVDYSDQVDAALESAKTQKLGAALEALYSLEKQTRVGHDGQSNARLVVAMVRLCFEAADWACLNETLVALSKKRSLIKQAVTKMVQECCTYVDKVPDDEQLKLVDTLRTVTAGKIYVEVERARLTYKLAKSQEADGDVQTACKTMLDLQVETFGSMDQKEKVELLLEQMRLCLTLKDNVRAQIISKKISTKFFANESTEIQQMKLTFYRHMIELDELEANYLNICRHYRAVYDTPLVQNDPALLDETLKNVVLYALLAPHDNEQWDLLHRIKTDRNLEKMHHYTKLLDLCTTEQVISWRSGIVRRFEEALRRGTASSPATAVFADTDAGRRRWEHLQTRIGEHNIRVIAKYYTRITLKRMAELLDWTVEKTEEFVCDLTVKGVIAGAKIDRPAGVVSFRPREDAVETLDKWANNLGNLTDTLNKVAHLIQKEEMVHRHLHAHPPA